MIKVRAFFLFIFLVFGFSHYGWSQTSLPFFSNLKHGKTNVRFGPNNNFPIKFELKCERLPVEIIKTHKDWYFIHDFEGESGWLHKRMVAQNDFVFLLKKSFLKKERKTTSQTIACLSRGVLVKLKNCHNKICCVEMINHKKKMVGWVPGKNLWGSLKLK
ncbi:SH3 domain-containing protein [Alphaproteobacteria bacterium]|nr:SH3 domain-containing protein [Alphaproteobacteria bacterium]